jgi:hypothetical protein
VQGTPRGPHRPEMAAAVPHRPVHPLARTGPVMKTPANHEARLEELLSDLRSAVREGHEAIKDLASLLKEYKKISADVAKTAERIAHESTSKQVEEFYEFMQKEMNRNAAELNKAIVRAREHIMECISVADIDIDRVTGQATFHFQSNDPFDENAEVTNG